MFKFENLIIESEFYKNYGYSKFDDTFLDSLEKKYLESDVTIFEILLKIGTEKKIINQLIFEFLKDTKFDIDQFNNINEFVYEQLEYYIWPFFIPIDELKSLFLIDKIKIYKCLTPRLEKYLQKNDIFIHKKTILKNSNTDMKFHVTENNKKLIKNIVKNNDIDVINSFLEKDKIDYGDNYYSNHVGHISCKNYSLRKYNDRMIQGNAGFIGQMGCTGFIGQMGCTGGNGPTGPTEYKVTPNGICIRSNNNRANFIYHNKENSSKNESLNTEKIFLDRIKNIKKSIKNDKIDKNTIWNNLFKNLTMTEIIYILSYHYEKEDINLLFENSTILKNYLFKDKIDDLCSYLNEEFNIDIKKIL